MYFVVSGGAKPAPNHGPIWLTLGANAAEMG